MLRLFLQKHQKYRILLLAGDLFIIISVISLILYLEAFDKNVFIWNISEIVTIYFVIITFTTTLFYILDLYNLESKSGLAAILFSIYFGVGLVITIYSALAYFIISSRLGNFNLVNFYFMTIIFTFAWRVSYKNLVGIKPLRLLFIGKDSIIEEICQIIQSDYGQYYTIEGRWHSHSHNPTLPNIFNFIEYHDIDTIVYAVHSDVAKRIANDLINIQFSNKRIVNAYNFYQYLTRKYPVYSLDDFSLLLNTQRDIFIPGFAERMKRAFDILFSSILLPLALPFLLISALAIKLDSCGPVLFIQERVGQNEVPFRIFKMRTMVKHDENCKPQWCIENDSRITRVGKILRKLRLDELPQLFNVLKGEMSLVGPRPIRKHFIDMLSKEIPFYKLRLLAKPGITGWGQINYGHAHTIEGHSQMAQYDLFYLVHQSAWLDLLILFKTIKVMFWGTGT